jgi:chromosomal replication initiation ATPase DnaA
MTEEEIKNELTDNERIAMKCVCDTLLNYEGRVRNYLADFVASLCNVEKEKMFSENNSLDVAQARWLFWYAYRYMTGETYEKIGRLSYDTYGKTFTKVGVASSVNKMSVMIEQQPIWKKRWTIVKRIIRITNSLIDENTEEPIKIIIPKNANVELKRE